MIKTLQSYIIFVLLLVAQKNSPMQTIAHNIEIPFAWNCMKMLDICMKCIEMLCFRMKYAVFARFCVKFSRLNALQSSAAPSTSTEAVIDDPTKTSPGDSHVPASVSKSMKCLFDTIWSYLAGFCLCFTNLLCRNAARSQTPLHWIVISVAPTCFEPGVLSSL